MKTTKVTRKLRQAISMLADEGMADCPDEAFITALKKGKLKTEQIYKVLSIMEYRWDARRISWVWKPRRNKSVRKVLSIAKQFANWKGIDES